MGRDIKIKLNKSPGNDGIVGEMIRALNERSDKELCELLQMVKLEEKIPEEWRKSIIVPIPREIEPCAAITEG